MKRYFAPVARLPRGWARDVLLEVDGRGNFSAVTPESAPGDAVRLGGPAIAGMPNVHSHAFQRALAGLAERSTGGHDSFWTWRETMYAFLDDVDPDEFERIATQLYRDLLAAGYTTVAEFQYVHNAADGSRYNDPAELSKRIVNAAHATGIGLTLLPSLYCYSNFGDAPPEPRQRRFVTSTDEFFAIWDELDRFTRDDPQITLGVAPHSLRAVGSAELGILIEELDRRRPEAPIHIHVAEQQREVDDSIALRGQRPIRWLLANAPVGERWTLVHATHATPDELRGIASLGATVGLCPTTEGNLGDGFFPLPAFLEDGGEIALGTDSHITLSVPEEVRWLEYAQRLRTERRTVVANAAEPSVGEALYAALTRGGARSTGRAVGAIQAGCRADLVVLDERHPMIAGVSEAFVLDRYLFAGDTRCIAETIVGGESRYRIGR